MANTLRRGLCFGAGLVMLAVMGGCGSSSSSTAASTTPVTAVTVYYGHSAAFSNISTMFTWGYNGSGQLGNGLVLSSSYPGVVIEGNGILRANGGLAIGAAHTLAFFNNSTVRAWGANFSGQLGDGTVANGVLNPVKVLGLSKVVAVAAGANHSLALTSDSTVYAWGSNYYGQLGINSIAASSPSPQQVTDAGPGTPLDGVTAIAAGGSHSLALSRGQVWGWGYNEWGQLGLKVTAVGSRVPVNVDLGGDALDPSNPNNVKLIAAGGAFSVAVKNDNTIWAWGYNGFGQLGQDPAVVKFSATPLQVAGIPGNILSVSAGLGHVLVLTDNGGSREIWGWGYNGYGQLGTGELTSQTPKVEQWEPVRVRQDSLGHYFAGTFGTGTVDGLHPVLAVGNHSLARTVEGLFGWGDNTFSQTGSPSTSYPYYRTLPTLILGM